MPIVRGLTILVATADPARFHAALSLAAAQAALGGRTRVHLQGEAVALLGAEGSLELTHLRAEAVTLGVQLSACQTGLAEPPGASLPAGIEADGLIGILTSLGDDRLLTF